MVMRKGLGKGKGKGYRNLLFKDKRVHSQSAKGMKQPQKSKELLIGGYGDYIPDSKFDKEQLRKGIKVEYEHTNDYRIAKEIAKDHLTEHEDYYRELEKMENKLEKRKNNYANLKNKSHETKDKLNKKLEKENLRKMEWSEVAKLSKSARDKKAKMMDDKVQGVSVYEFFKKAFNKEPADDLSYYSDWVRRFEQGNPEKFMSKKNREIFQEMSGKKGNNKLSREEFENRVREKTAGLNYDEMNVLWRRYLKGEIEPPKKE